MHEQAFGRLYAMAWIDNSTAYQMEKTLSVFQPLTLSFNERNKKNDQAVILFVYFEISIKFQLHMY